MTVQGIIALLISMVVLAAMPSLSVLTVVARSSAAGFRHGAATSLGIVTGDILFIIVAILGLGLIADVFDTYFDILKIVAGLYLLYLAFHTFNSSAGTANVITETGMSLAGSYSAGLLLTLADHKAILFYLVFLPAFIQLEQIRPTDVFIIIAVTIIAVGGVKLAYALLASRIGMMTTRSFGHRINMLAAAVLCAVGIYLIAMK